MLTGKTWLRFSEYMARKRELPGRPIRERITVLRTLMPGLRIIVTSIHPESREQALSEGADEFISKSDAPAKILEAIQKCYRAEE